MTGSPPPLERLQTQLDAQPNTNTAKNVIVLVSDGNGVGTNYASRLWAGQQEGGLGDDYNQPHDLFPNLALVKTYNVNAQTPDSAGTGTAMMSGVKTKGRARRRERERQPRRLLHSAGQHRGLDQRDHDRAGQRNRPGVDRAHHPCDPGVGLCQDRRPELRSNVPEGCTEQADIATQLIEAMRSGVIDLAMGGGMRNFHAVTTAVAAKMA